MREPKPFKTWHLVLIILVVVISVGYRIYGYWWNKAVVRIGGQELRVLVADTYAHRLKGWSGKKDMGKYGGMLFVFPEKGQHNMVMRDMRFPLDIIWLDGNTVVDIAPNVPPQSEAAEEELTVYRARAASTMVLELPAGFKDRTGIKIGDKAEIIRNNKTVKDNLNILSMKLTSPVFMEGGSIPAKYTCDGQGINPPLEISGVPAGAKSLVLLMDDPDIPEAAKQNFNTDVWDHWVMFNIPANTKQIIEGTLSSPEGENPAGVLGKNTGGQLAYGGPCPPDREHRYFFKLYALDAELNLPAGATKAEVEAAMGGHILETAQLMGRYSR